MSKSQKSDIRLLTLTVHKTTSGPGDVVDLTDDIQNLLSNEGFWEGAVLVFVVGSTAGITTLEFEPGLVKDVGETWQRLVPQGPDYAHHKTWGDANGFSHLRAAIQGPSLTVPFKDGMLMLGRWQNIVLLEFDDRPRERSIVIQFSGL